MRKPVDPKRRGIQLAELFQLGEDHKIRLAAQVGITHAIVGVNPALAKVSRTEYVAVLRKIRAAFEAAGLVFAGVESHPVPAEKINLACRAGTRKSKTT